MSSTPPRNPYLPLWSLEGANIWTYSPRQINLSAGSSQASLMDLPQAAGPQAMAMRSASPPSINMPSFWGVPQPFTSFGLSYGAPMQTVPMWPMAFQSLRHNLGRQRHLHIISPSDYGTMSSSQASPDPEEYIRNVIVVNHWLPPDYVCHRCDGRTPDGGKHHISQCQWNNPKPDDFEVPSFDSNKNGRCVFWCSTCGHVFEAKWCCMSGQRKCYRCGTLLYPWIMYKCE